MIEKYDEIAKKKRCWKKITGLIRVFGKAMGLTGLLLILGIGYVVYFSDLYGENLGEISGFITISSLLGFTYIFLGSALYITVTASKFLPIRVDNINGIYNGLIKPFICWFFVGLYLGASLTWFVIAPFGLETSVIILYMAMSGIFLPITIFEISGQESAVPFWFGGIGFGLSFILLFTINPYDLFM